jgi:hypothetical protein
MAPWWVRIHDEETPRTVGGSYGPQTNVETEISVQDHADVALQHRSVVFIAVPAATVMALSGSAVAPQGRPPCPSGQF